VIFEKYSKWTRNNTRVTYQARKKTFLLTISTHLKRKKRKKIHMRSYMEEILAKKRGPLQKGHIEATSLLLKRNMGVLTGLAVESS
jgi:hypothetical protein